MLRQALGTSRLKVLSIPIHVPFTISRESLALAQIILIEVEDAEGYRGIGEAAPFPSLTNDTIPQAVAVANDLLEALKGLTVRQAMDYLSVQRQEIITQSITAFVGVESALWDLTAKQQGRSLAQLWGHSSLTMVETDITLPIMEPENITSFWQRYQHHDFRMIKVKVSGHLDQDLDMIQELRRVVPKSIKLSLDGNQGFTVASALELVSRLHKHGCFPLFFEQPLPADDDQGAARLQQALAIPVCLDETVKSYADAQRALAQGLGKMINIKIMKSGIAEALKIITLSQKHQIPLMIGGMLESEIAMGISLQMACATGAISFADLDTPFFFTKRISEHSPWHTSSANLKLPAGPGHGIVIKDQVVEEFQISPLF